VLDNTLAPHLRCATTLTLPSSGLALKNRIVKAAMEEGLADAALDPTPGLQRLYARWAEGGAGLVLTGHVVVDRGHRGRPRDVVLDERSDLAAFRSWAAAARANGARVFMQLNHAGRQTPRFINRAPKAPSGGVAVKAMKSFAPPVALDAHEIANVVKAFAFAAARAEEAGFDGVELHAAHGYLLSQFLSPLSNQRTDSYGGSLENRARLVLEIIRAMRAVTRPSFGLGIKINSADFQRGGFDGDDFKRVVQLLDGEAIDFIEVSGGNYEAPAMVEGNKRSGREGYFMEFVEAVRSITKLPLFITGGMRSRAGMEQALASGADLVGLARPMAVDPALPNKLLSGELTTSPVGPVLFGRGAVRGLADTAWHAAQISRIARGLEPDPSLSPLVAAVRYIVGDMFLGYREPRPRAISSSVSTLPA
jgi:2,4-dienoyl-CoA reductase-like NADH-dependent reductase (Old Yellow Enzyme family)